jgi:hypothetical protein
LITDVLDLAVGWRPQGVADAQIAEERTIRCSLRHGYRDTDRRNVLDESLLFFAWSEDELARHRRRHPLGSTARLALELFLGTAQRPSGWTVQGLLIAQLG